LVFIAPSLFKYPAPSSKRLMLTNDSVGSNRALKRYSRHRRQRTDCCYKRAAERRSLSRPCRPSKYLAGLTCSDPGTAPKSMAPRGDVWPTQPDRLMQKLEGTEALRALRCERFLSSSPSLLPLVLTQSPAEYILLGLSAPAAAPAPSGSVHGYVPINFSQNLREGNRPIEASDFGLPPPPRFRN
jgi:hypothetical protein